MTAPPVTVRRAEVDDLDAVARTWAKGWQDAHAAWVGPELSAARTESSFRSRAVLRRTDTLVALKRAAILGFVIVVDDEVEQIYADAAARGLGVAARLLSEAEHVVTRRGFDRAWLAVIPENTRARRFYEKSWWQDDGDFVYAADGGGAGDIRVPCRRYSKALDAPPPRCEASVGSVGREYR